MPEWALWIPAIVLYAGGLSALSLLAFVGLVLLRRSRLAGVPMVAGEAFPTEGRRPVVSPATGRGGRPVILPPPVARFTGRAAEEDEVAAALEAGAAAVIHGPSGIGKSALAVRVAHRLLNEGRFRDGAVYVDLRAGGTAPASALKRLLQHIGVIVGAPPPDTDPTEVEAGLSALWRRETQGRDMLILIDDAPAGAAIAPFLPGAGATLLTTSVSVPDLKNAHVTPLKPLSAPEARGLVLAAAPSLTADVVERIVSASSGAPLILTAASAAAVAAGHGGGGAALDDLEAQEAESAAALTSHRMAWAIDNAPGDLVAAWSALSLWREGFFTDAAAAAWGVNRAQAERWLRELADRRLLKIDPIGQPFEAALGARWTLPPRLAPAAAMRLEAEPRSWSARIGWMRAECAMLESAERLHASGGAGVGQGLALLDLELAAITGAAELAGAAAETDNAAAEMAVRFAEQPMLSLRLPSETLSRWTATGLTGARRLGDSEAVKRLGAGLAEPDPAPAVPEAFEIVEERRKPKERTTAAFFPEAPAAAPQATAG